MGDIDEHAGGYQDVGEGADLPLDDLAVLAGRKGDLIGEPAGTVPDRLTSPTGPTGGSRTRVRSQMPRYASIENSRGDHWQSALA